MPDGVRGRTVLIAGATSTSGLAAAHALTDAGADVAPLVRQREALRALGLGGAAPLPLDAPGPVLLQALAERSAVGELLDPAGLGGFSWLAAGAGRPAPELR